MFLNKYPNIRVIFQDSIAVTPSGRVSTLGRRYDAPLLILNRDELSKRGIKQVLESGVYRRIFSDSNRAEHELSLIDDLEEKTDKLTRILIDRYGCKKREYIIDYLGAQTDSEKTKILENIYDELISKVDIDSVIKQANKILNPPFSYKLSTALKIVLSKSLEPFKSTLKNSKKLSFFYKIAINFSYKNLYERMFPPKIADKEKATRELSETLSKYIPSEYLVLMNYFGANIALGDSLSYYLACTKNIVASSIYRDATIYVICSEIRSPCAILEEFTHHIDTMFGFSKLNEWKAAVEIDLKSNKVIKEFRCYNPLKKDIRTYAPHKIPIEFLADVVGVYLKHCRVSGVEKAESHMQQVFPNTFPFAKKFLGNIKNLSEQLSSGIQNEIDSKEVPSISFIKKLEEQIALRQKVAALVC